MVIAAAARAATHVDGRAGERVGVAQDGEHAPDEARPVTGRALPELAPLDRMMTAFMDAHDVPGAALAVARDGKLVYARGFGHARGFGRTDRERARPVEPTSRFRIASVSKPLTAVCVLQLVEAGRFELDTPLVELIDLPDGTAFADSRIGRITVQDVLWHRGGWDRGASFDPMFATRRIVREQRPDGPLDSPPTKGEIRDFVLARPLDHDPGLRYTYSNFGYLLLGLAIESTSGQDYANYATEHVLEPIGVRHMQLGRSLPADRPADEVEYDGRGRTGRSVFGAPPGAIVAAPDGSFQLEVMDAHGGWIASAPDLVRFASAVDLAGANLLAPESVAAMVARPPGSEDARVWYGCGWSVRDVDGESARNLWHTGALPGTSALLVARHDGFVWAVLFNAREGEGGRDLAALIDPLVHRAVDAVEDWPEDDLFDELD
ncbi:serine hydrolase domain-containing protein [Planctomycetes bacterium Pla163]|uniref:serine hydrolase domain-containing protein n=1 Tax=Rohdeia mirabilis TaxID=2528008 RepID=UPI0011A6F5F7